MKICRLMCVFLITIWVQSNAETTPVKGWSKTFSSNCLFVGGRGDSIVCVTDRIIVLSSAGTVLSQSQSPVDLKNVTNNQLSFGYLKDNTLLMLKNRYLVSKINLNGEVLWTTSLKDTFPLATCNDFIEDNENNLFFCGDINYNSGIIVKIAQNGEPLFCKRDTSFVAFFSITSLKDTLYLSSSTRDNFHTPSIIVSYDKTGKLTETVADRCNAMVLAIANGHILSLGAQDVGSLFKTKFSVTRDLFLEKYSLNGTLIKTATFDFGKYENPLEINGFGNSFVMITISDETLSFGTNILNYFVTGFDDNLQMVWQLHFGTDMSGMNGVNSHYRNFCADLPGTILASHNDTLVVYKTTPLSSGGFEPSSYGTTIRTKYSGVYDLRGCLLPLTPKNRYTGEYPVYIPASGIRVHENGKQTAISVRR
jgi:hypothetical protein